MNVYMLDMSVIVPEDILAIEEEVKSICLVDKKKAGAVNV